MAQENGHAETSELPCARCGFDCILSSSACQKALSPPLFMRHFTCLSSPSSHRCGKAAKLQCPKCLEMQLPKQPSVFCSQDCFKVRRQLTHLACPCCCRQRALHPGCAACPCCAAQRPVAILQPCQTTRVFARAASLARAQARAQARARVLALLHATREGPEHNHA